MEKLEENFEKLFEESVKEVKLDKYVTGKIIEITSKGEIFVDLGYKADGIIPNNEYSDNYNEDPRKEFKVGDEITAELLKMNDGYGNVLLSYKRAKNASAQKELEEQFNSGTVLEGKVEKTNGKGLIVNNNGVEIFIPLSLSGLRRNENAEDYVGKNVKFKLVEFDLRRRRVIGSIKVLLEETKKEENDKFWNEVVVGKEYKGKVTSVTNYGAFVDLGAVQGLLHVSEMSWNKNTNPMDLVEAGQEVEVTVKSFDKETGKVELASNMKGEDPWNKVSEKYKVTDVVEVEVVKITKFGAFVKLEEGIEGLVHISQIAEEKITDISTVLKVGQKLNAKIIDIDLDKKKIELSIRELIGTNYETKSEVEE